MNFARPLSLLRALGRSGVRGIRPGDIFAFALLLAALFPVSIPVSIFAEPRTAGEWHTLSQGWYDIEYRYGPDGEFYYHFDVSSLDGYRSRLVVFPAGESEPKDMVLFVPDYSTQSYERLLQIVADLRGEKKFHAALLIPRGHRPVIRNQLHGAQGVQELARNKVKAAAMLNDFRAGLSALKETAPTLNVKIGRTCIVAGDYYSNLLLTEALPDVACMVLLSPNRKFYDEDLAQIAAKEIRVPVLFAAAARFRFELTGLVAGMEQATLLIRSGAGNGYAMLYRKPDLVDEIRSFLKEPAAYVKAQRAPPVMN
ncbi:MAG: hypothetical protein NXI24_14155 [bacterium]|nr:hypothetical protein [bacterium]